MRILFRKIKSGFVLTGKIFTAIGFYIKKYCTVTKCIFISCFSKEEITYIEHAEEKLDKLYPDKGYNIDNASFRCPACKDLSIIIATFNAEKYIEECLESIIRQKTVNDGSTDLTAEKIKPFLSDKRVKYFEQKNTGQSAARNFAIFNSIGRYLMIVDSDDIIAEGSIDYLMRLAINNGCDIAEGKVQMFYKNIEFVFSDNIKIIKPNDKAILRSVGYSVAKVYKRELWEKVSYPVGYIFEDIITKFILRRKANKIAVSDSVIYGYRVGINSSSHGNGIGKFADGLRILPKIWTLCEKNDMPKDKTFYLLSLNHIGLLNYIMLKSQTEELKKLAFSIMQNKLNSISAHRPTHMPLMFRLLDKSVKRGKIKTWQYLAESIIKYRLLKNYREIN